jgi:hypothetical protein
MNISHQNKISIEINMPTEETLRVMLSAKLEEGRATTAYAATIFTFYLGINAVLFKYVIGNALVEDKMISIISALLTGIVYLLVCYMYWCSRRFIVEDINFLNEHLGKPLHSEQLIPLKYTALSAGLFSIFSITIWLILLVRNL